MTLLLTSIPRVPELQGFYQDPLTFLAEARSAFGNIFVLREGAPLFSRAPECAGAIAVFGSAYHQAVLTNTDLFGMPVSAAQHLSLPPRLVNLNRGLHSMRGDLHDQHQRLLMRELGDRNIDERHQVMCAAFEQFVQSWRPGQQIALLAEMRRWTLEVSSRLLFGDRYDESASLGALAAEYFHFRREVAATFKLPSDKTRARLIALGTSLDDALRRHVGWSREEAGGPADSLLGRLARLDVRPGARFTEDEMVAHGNVLFMSSIEPTAVALTWTLLILSQLPELRRALRDELDQSAFETTPSAGEVMPSAGALSALPLLDSVINESLRVLTPNAIMVRLTTQAGFLADVPLPEKCEVLFCPFLSHRDPNRFPRPDEFLPSRWQTTRPSPFEFFPFGGGGHYCVGRSLALHIFKVTLASLLRRYELVLSSDQEIDWQVDIILMPENDPIMEIQSPGTTPLEGGKLRGPVSELIRI